MTFDRSRAPFLVDIGGRHLCVQIFGSGPTVVLDTGGTGQGVGTWNLMAPEIIGTLEQSATVLTYDRAGIGRSDPGPLPRTVPRMVEDLHALLHTLDIALPAVVAGWSYGGLVMQMYAALHPQDIAGMVLIDPTPAEAEPASMRRSMRRARPLQILDYWKAASGFNNTALGRRLIERAVDRQAGGDEKMAKMIREFASNARAKREMLELFAEHEGNIAAAASAIDQYGLPPVPLRVISAGLFPGVPEDHPLLDRLVKAHERLAARSPFGQRIVAERAGHQIPLEQPDIIVEEIKNVLSAVASAPHTATAPVKLTLPSR